MRMRALLLAALSLAGVSMALAGSVPARLAPTVVQEVRETLVERYYRPVPQDVLRQTTVDAMLDALGDPYTEYLDPNDVQELQRQAGERYSGIGLTVTPQDAGLLVTSAPPGPGRKAGIRPGDLIIRINGVPTAQLTVDLAVARILGPKGTTVTIGVRRKHTILIFHVVRDTVRTPNISSRVASFFDRRVGIVHVYRFGKGTATQVRAQAEHFDSIGLTGMILDLRNNPGGLLDEGVGTVSAFVRDAPVVTITGAHETKRTYRTDGSASVRELPLVVLVNRFSASSAEIVASALRDAGRAVIVGEPTFGNALVQDVEPLNNGGALKLTVARYLTARGKDIDGIGVTPDVRAVDDPATTRNEAFAEAVAQLPEP